MSDIFNNGLNPVGSTTNSNNTSIWNVKHLKNNIQKNSLDKENSISKPKVHPELSKVHPELSIKMITEADFLSTNVMIEENSHQDITQDYEAKV